MKKEGVREDELNWFRAIATTCCVLLCHADPINIRASLQMGG